MEDYRNPELKWSEDGNVASFTCKHIGVAGTTPVFVRRTPTTRKDFPFKYEFRMGIAIFGCMCDPESYRKSPFDADWRDNYVGAKGYTLEACTRAFERELHSLAESLW